LQEQTFHERILGYSISVFREISLRTRATISLETRFVETTESGVDPDYTTRLTRVEVATDHRDNPFDASSGRYQQAQVDYAGGLLGGTNEFGRLSLAWQGYHSPRRGLVLAARVRAGYIEPFSNSIARSVDSPTTPDSLEVARVPWEERFRLGGSNTVRGYPENDIGLLNERGEALGGLVLGLVNLEVRFPLIWILHGGLFVDFGNVWADPARVSLGRFVDGLAESGYDPLNVFYGAGGGLRVGTPVGPVRLDYGFKIGSGRAPGDPAGELHFGLGQAF
jgi:outer membrane protein assembly factor BamA